MNFYKICITILSFLFILSCNSKNDKENIVEPVLSYDDNEIFEQLSKDNKNNVGFFPDSTFFEIGYGFNMDTKEEYKLYERKGKYKVENNLIVLSNVNVKYDTTLGSISIIWFGQEVHLEDGELKFKVVSVLETDSYKNSLWNYWRNIKWTYHYVKETNIIYSGREEYFYEFNSTSSKVRWGHNYIDGSPWAGSEYSSDYTYDPPYLQLVSEAERYKVEFKKEKMYWYLSPSLDKKNFMVKSNFPFYSEVKKK